MTQVMRPVGPETLRDIMNELAGRPRPQTVPCAIVDLLCSPKPEDTIATWSRDVLLGFRSQLSEERTQLPPHPDTTEFMRFAAEERYDPDSASLTAAAYEPDEWLEYRNGMVDRRVAGAAWRGIQSLGERMLGRTVNVLERVLEPVFAVVDQEAAVASERFDRSISGE